MRVIGIDPGTARIGYGVVEYARGAHRAISWGVIEPRAATEPERLRELGEELGRLMETFRPARAGVERIYFSKNQKTAMAVAQARGVILFSLLTRGIPIIELQPAEIKRAVANYGFADKRAVAKMVAAILKLEAFAGWDDASDALAAAIAAATYPPQAY